MNRSESFEQAENAVKAIMETMDWLDVCRYAMTDAKDSMTDQVDAEVRDAMEKASDALVEVMENIAGPIWGMLPENVREICRNAGM